MDEVRENFWHLVSTLSVFEELQDAYCRTEGVQVKMRRTIGGKRVGEILLCNMPVGCVIAERHSQRCWSHRD